MRLDPGVYYELIDGDAACPEHAKDEQDPSKAAREFNCRLFHVFSPDIVAERAQSSLADFPAQSCQLVQLLGAVRTAITVHPYPLCLLLRELAVDVARQQRAHVFRCRGAR